MRENRALLFTASGGMELSWLYAWATFLTTSILNQPFPFPEAVGSFALAAAITYFSQGRGWRVIAVLGLQAFGFLPALVRIVHVFNSWSYSFSSQTWATEVFGSPQGAGNGVTIFLVLVWAYVFWGGGVRLATRSTDYLTLCSRFDRGLVAFFILFLAKFLFLVRGGIKLDDPVSEFLIFPFFVFSLLAIGLARNRTAAQRDFLPGYQGIGVILSFAVIVLLFGTGLVFFFLPYLTLAAEKGYGLLKVAAVPVGSILLKVIRFLFGYGALLPEKSLDRPQGEILYPTSPGKSSGWLELLEKILAWGLWIILGFFLLTACGVALFYLSRWLLSRTPVDRRRQSPWSLILLWAEGLRQFLLSRWRALALRVKGYTGAVELYTALLRWGRHSGLPHFSSETPMEYGLRLESRFPVLKREIGLIIDSFNQAVYGEIVLGERQLATVRFALRRLRSPYHWPLRLKAFLRPVDQGQPAP